MSPDPEKVEAIRKADRPVNAKELSSFLGMASYSACFISDFATIAAPLRELTHKGLTWESKDIHGDAFQKLKLSMSETTVMTHYNPNKDRSDLCCISCCCWGNACTGRKNCSLC